MYNLTKTALMTGALIFTIGAGIDAQAASQQRLIQRDKLNTTVDEFKHELRSCRTQIDKLMLVRPLQMKKLQTLRLKCRLKLEHQLGTMLISLSDIGTALDAEIAEINGPAKPDHK